MDKTMKRPNRVAAIHDISAFGRVSLAVVPSIISIMGAQVCPIPTMVLSTHLSFADIAIERCDDFPGRCLNHWKKNNIEVDMVYSGYLGSPSQVAQVKAYREHYPNAFFLVDPVLADDGEPYQGVLQDMIDAMRELASSAEIITPNPTEASLLLKEPYSPVLPVAEAKSMLLRLASMGGTSPLRSVIITGQGTEEHGICNLFYDFKSNQSFFVRCDYRRQTGLSADPAKVYGAAAYPGTGDIFSSVIAGSIMRGDNLGESVCLATEFIEHCMDLTVCSGESPLDGVFFEYALPILLKTDCRKTTEPL